MDGRMNSFFKESMKKESAFELLRRAGKLKTVDRNPLRCEKTPRKDFHGFDFSIPPAAIVHHQQWSHPENDWGLLSKFSSQKKVFDKYFEKQREYEQKAKEVREFREEKQKENQEFIDKENKALIEHRKLTEVKKQKKKYDDKIDDYARMNPFETTDEILRSDLEELKSKNKTILINDTVVKNTKKEEKTFQNRTYAVLVEKSTPLKTYNNYYEQPISTFKSEIINDTTTPSLLSSWRAKRAADFINTLKNPIEPPNERQIGSVGFRPAGKLLHGSKSKILQKTGSEKELEALLKTLDKAKFDHEKQYRKMLYNDKII